MGYITTDIEGVVIFEPRLFKDERGFFYESFNWKSFSENTSHQEPFVQDNISRSTRGVLRGLHYQLDPHAQAKLVTVLHGAVLDVAVDIRKGSPTYGRHVKVLLNDENRRQLLVPRGFAHGFVVLSETADFFYKCDNFYNKESEGGIAFDDPALGIDWELSASELIVSEKDKEQPLFESANNNFTYK